MLKRFVSVVVMLCIIVAAGCGKPSVRMATTTSTDNSGLLDYLLPLFSEESGVVVDVIAVGTGKALKYGENGDVDVVLVHARKAEDAFVESGFGIARQEVMYNDFIIIGPSENPLSLDSKKSVVAAFKKLGKGKSLFVSRGDNSGTHIKEKELWCLAGIEPAGSWYLEAGQGMGATLKVADEKRAYCLVDRGTYLAYMDKIQLKICVEGGDELVKHVRDYCCKSQAS